MVTAAPCKCLHVALWFDSGQDLRATLHVHKPPKPPKPLCDVYVNGLDWFNQRSTVHKLE